MGENDLKWLGDEKNILLFLKQFQEKIVLKPLGLWKFSHSSEMQNVALMHREGLKG